MKESRRDESMRGEKSREDKRCGKGEGKKISREQ